jgi:hypothetical protein
MKYNDDMAISWWQRLLGATMKKECLSVSLPIGITRADGVVEPGILSLIDTTTAISVLDRGLATRLGIYAQDLIIERKSGEELGFGLPKELYELIAVTYEIQGETRRGQWAVVDRSAEKHLVVLSKTDLVGFCLQL